MPPSKSSNRRKNRKYRRLYKTEIAMAKEVYKDTLPYRRILISNVDSSTQGITLATSPNSKKAKYLILWKDAFFMDITTDHEFSSVLIHELAHVWQGQYGKNSFSYMFKSAWSQFTYGVQDIFKNSFGDGVGRILEMTQKGFVREWDYHRGAAYSYEMDEVGKDFKEFNVEQQALIIETWFRKETYSSRGKIYPAGYASKQDSRYPYIRDCIQAKDPYALYQI